MRYKQIITLAVVMICLLSTLMLTVGADPDNNSISKNSDDMWGHGVDESGFAYIVENTSTPSIPPSFQVNVTQDPPQEIGGGQAEPAYPKVPTATPRPTLDVKETDTEKPKEEKQTIIQKVLFPFEKLEEGVRNAIGKLVEDLVLSMVGIFQNSVKIVQETLFFGDSDFIRGPQQKVWMGMMLASAILIPLSFSLVVASSMKHGAASITGYAFAREALVEWAIAIAAAASSYFLLTKVGDLSSALMRAINEGLMAQIDTPLGVTSGEMIFGKILIHLQPDSGFDIGNIILMIFGFILSLCLMVSIVFSMVSREVILMLSFGLAPLILIIGTIPMLRWIRGMWLKVTVLAFLLGPLNVLLIDISAVIVDNISLADHTAAKIQAVILFLIILGIISVLIGMNGMISKTVYGSAIEIANSTRRGLQSAFGVGLKGARAYASSLTYGRGWIAGRNRVRAAANSSGDSSQPGSLKTAQAQATLSNQIGQGLARSSNPGVKGYGNGLSKGALNEAQRQLDQSINSGLASSSGGLSNPVSGIATGKENFYKTHTSGPAMSNGISDEEIMRRGNSAEGALDNMLEAAKNVGWNVDTLLGDLGTDYSGFTSYTLDKFAFPNENKFIAPNPIDNLPDERRINAETFKAGVQIASRYGTQDNGANDWTSERFKDLYQAIGQQRGRNMPFTTIIDDAIGSGDITAWISRELDKK